MGEPPSGLFRSWLHSYEEDHEDVRVYRPDDFPFPPARGRRGMEFAPDGTFVDHPLGRGDAPGAVPGRWRLVPDHRIEITFGGARPDRELEIVRCGTDVLQVRRLT
ncbi:hypothetical protein A4E84_31335 [Streptomyces qaidamensis]|uniref:Uncharacterized protein n=1 Tax=Streptomyces qaidamensis TaxID=1783515 RepID=A0A143C833_9ACTN|nr:hypothetical protein [Streptomyces qaidamensis]AMW13606.1 hypothetical protein A4E84_31335 [Streptomyces qaidamensis]